MFIKKVVASLGTLSLVTVGLLNSGAVLAAQADQDATDMTALKDRVSQMEATLATLSQTADRAPQQNQDWSKYIRLSGGLNVDAKLAGSLGSNVTPSSSNDATTAGRFTGENVQRVGINDAYLNVDVLNVSDWATARVGATYSNTSAYYNSFVRSNNDTGSSNSSLNLDQAYVTIANFSEYPYYGRAGLQYVDYGVYDLHPITKPFTQVMTELNDVALQVGFMDESGLRGSAFVLPTPTTRVDSDGVSGNNNQFNYGASFAFANTFKSGSIDYVAKVGYLANIVGLNVWQRDSSVSTAAGSSQLGGSYHSAVPGIAANFDVKSGPFDAGIGYAGATRAFSDNDVVYQTGKNAKPVTATATAGYTFKFWENRDNRVGVEYDRSSQASPFGLPRHRYGVNYGVDLYKNTNLTLQWDHDIDYGTSYLTSVEQSSTPVAASGKNYNVISARLGVNFG